MAKLIAFYSRADENYFGGSKKYIKVGNTEKAANMIAELTGADLFKIEQKIPYAADYDTCIAQAKKDKTFYLVPSNTLSKPQPRPWCRMPIFHHIVGKLFFVPLDKKHL